MYADYNPETVEDKIHVADAARADGYIKRLSTVGLCMIPTEVGGSASTYFPDYFYTNWQTSKGLRVRAAGGYASDGSYAGAFCVLADCAASDASAYYSSPLCEFEDDPTITA